MKLRIKILDELEIMKKTKTLYLFYLKTMDTIQVIANDATSVITIPSTSVPTTLITDSNFFRNISLK